MMRTAIITGITGQDGSYMAELLLTKGYKVVGAVRNIENATASLSDYLLEEVELVEWSMLNQQIIERVLLKCRPDELYNFAAYSSGSGMYADPVELSEVNGIAVARMLDAIRVVDPKIHFCQASSREIFGLANTSPQAENTPANPRSPYGAAKLYADSMIRIYRNHYGLFACSAILFNHESPRRGLCFVTRKITHEAARIKLGYSTKLCLGNLDAERDWGFAGDYVRAMWLMLQKQQANDYVIATGEVHSVREFCEIAFNYLGLKYQDYIVEDESIYRPSEPVLLVGNAAKAKSELNWKPELGFRELVHMMVDAEMQCLSENKQARR